MFDDETIVINNTSVCQTHKQSSSKLSALCAAADQARQQEHHCFNTLVQAADLVAADPVVGWRDRTYWISKLEFAELQTLVDKTNKNIAQQIAAREAQSKWHSLHSSNQE